MIHPKRPIRSRRSRRSRILASTAFAAFTAISLNVNAQDTPEIPEPPPPPPQTKPEPPPPPPPPPPEESAPEPPPPPPHMPADPEPPAAPEPPMPSGPGVGDEAEPPPAPGEGAGAGAPKREKVKSYSTPSPSGESGLIRVMSADAAAPRTVRVSFGLEFFTVGSFFGDADETNRVGGVLGVSGSPVKHLELWLNTRAQSTRSILTQPELLQAQGDLTFGAKGYYPVSDVVTIGLDLGLTLLTGIGEASFNLDSSQFTIRGLGTFDLSHTKQKVPLRINLNFGGTVDGSKNLSTEVLSDAERFALGMSDFDRLGVGLALEVPVKYVTPYLEYSMEVPLGYLATPGIVLNAAGTEVSSRGLRAAQAGTTPVEPDIARPSIQRAMPQRLTPGIRITAIPDLTLDAAVEIGLTPDTATGVIPPPPFNVIFLATYTIDPFSARGSGPAGPPISVPVIVPEVREISLEGKMGYLMGRVISKKGGNAIDGVLVTFDRSPPVATAQNGRFLSHHIDPGPVVVRFEKIGFKPASADATIAAGETQEMNVEMEPAFVGGKIQGRVLDPDGGALGDVEISLLGPKGEKHIRTNTDGRFELEAESGEYSVTGGGDDLYRIGARLKVEVDRVSTLTLTLQRRPASPIAFVADGKIRLETPIEFGEGQAELSAEAKVALDAAVDVLLSRPDIKKVRVESHVDNKNGEEEAARVTQARAQAVADYVISRGVPPVRLQALGAGATKPIAPNLTERGRKLNRRIELHIAE